MDLGASSVDSAQIVGDQPPFRCALPGRDVSGELPVEVHAAEEGSRDRPHVDVHEDVHRV